MIWVVLVYIVPLVLGKVCPGGHDQCPDTATCCQLSNLSYGCCPLKNAVCCDDHIHCCPHNSKCDVGMCIQNNLNVTAHKLSPKADDHPCPTEESSCLDNYTCCSNVKASVYGCCPLPNAVCCSDGSHCCPTGTVCDLETQRCLPKSYSFLKHNFLESKPKPKKLHKSAFATIVMKAKKVASVVCPGAEFQCPDGYTCCKLPNGNWGCCPFVNATCCQDHLHCCPENLKCDSTSESCLQGSYNVTWALNKRALKVSKNDIICPDERHCPEDTTCCQLESGSYGCCTYTDAVCCSDHLHCCPNGYDCDVQRRQCVHTATCCQLPNLSYGCCPLKNAVCCNDHIHCCPQNSKCDVGKCTQSDLNFTAYKISPKAQDHPCPTEESSCLDNYTCCSNVKAGVYGCCPLPNSVCCSDGSHCCPTDTICDLEQLRCLSKSYSFLKHNFMRSKPKSKKSHQSAFATIITKSKRFASVVCPGAEFQCPDAYTCCKLPNGNWGCCPFKNATCCQDHLHCCPENLKCDSTSESCRQGSYNVTWASNKPAVGVDIICPDRIKHCPENTTCCQLTSGGYGCCAYADAVCCEDGLYCCPKGYECDVISLQCSHKNSTLHKVLSRNEINYI